MVIWCSVECKLGAKMAASLARDLTVFMRQLVEQVCRLAQIPCIQTQSIGIFRMAQFDMINGWPPSRKDFFRGNNPSRPVFQGDIFQNVPFIKGQAGDLPGADPKVRVERRMVVALSYPCEMYSNGSLAKVQTIAV